MTSAQKGFRLSLVSELYEIVYSGKPVRVVVANNFVEVAKKAKRASVDIVKKLLSVPHIHIDEKGAFFYPISKKDGDVKFVRLKSKELKDGLDEVKKRKIHRRDNSRGASKKLTEIRRCYEAFEKLQDVLEGFTWKGFESLKLKNSTVPTDLYLKSGSRQLLFNAQWIKLTAEKDIAAKLRSFVQYT